MRKEFRARTCNTVNEIRKARKKAKRELKRVEDDGQELYTKAIERGHKMQSELQGAINHMPLIPRAFLALKILFGRWK